MPVKIKVNIKKRELTRRFISDLKKDWISSEHWFIQNVDQLKKLYSPKNFYKVVSFYTTPSKEYEVILKNKSKIITYLGNKNLVIWGSGIKEAKIINWASDINKKIKITIIDIKKEYINDMIKEIKNIKELNISVIVDLFQKINLDKRGNNFHIFLGTAIGNFKQNEIFLMLKNNMGRGDIIMIGFQLHKNKEKILKEYRDDKNFTKSISLKIFDNIVKQNKAKQYWIYNLKKNQVEFWLEFIENINLKVYGTKLKFLKGERIEIFRSKKYDDKKFSNFAKKYKLKTLDTFIEAGHCIKILEKQ